MLTHYIDFKVIEGATNQDAGLVHGSILSVFHFNGRKSTFAFDFPGWSKEVYAGKVMRVFDSSENLNELLVVLQPLLLMRAATHSGIKEVPADAALSDYVYTQSRPGKGRSPSHKRRFERRNPNKVWVEQSYGAGYKKPEGYRLDLTSNSSQSAYFMYVKRTTDIASATSSAGLGIRIPLFKE
ncbi:MAG: hypothetical protein RBR82_15550 [Pseudomonas sp.]|nr:hypothetical protein [Pseudomonas sp.]